ncbi:hypothetical protein Nepgr_011958 [Nepenthes gracilis]|uniref:Uncharacterized protein n=1 Tax=Nepenthes gracilis TaxID=150966 RepID=A0AAD3SF91_NEPGR|nr:hypothetical protein Nepgr_011958 [Nepenthes gracilis]
MSSVCISSCVNDTRVPVRVRATYVNLYKWPESDAEFVRSVSSRGAGHPRPRVVDSISCRQLYLRSYTFTREESMNERTINCIGRVKEKVVNGGKNNNNSDGKTKKKKKKKKKSNEAVRKVREVPCAALKAIFRKLLFCSASVDVVHGND